ncbi:hypothetical protein ACODM8_06860 [Vibrio ostreicida]|uniref:hypothetical protein n=1 Tax=Vibrio ostreicida TaxID=526588 RepID=UPI000A032F4E|nr:hypothetical protein [Vibrio ostreicida]
MLAYRGAATMMLVTLLVIATSIIVMGSARALFYQIQQSHNEVAARQAHWQIEGGLECVYSQVQILDDPFALKGLSQCQAAMQLDSLSVEVGIPIVVRATRGFMTHQKSFRLPQLTIKSPITAVSDLIINGAITVSPEPGNRVAPHRWACVSVRYQNRFFATSYSTLHPYLTAKSSRYFPQSNAQGQHQCAPESYTDFTWQLSSTSNDFVQVHKIDAFHEVFNVPRTRWLTVMKDESTFGYIPSGLMKLSVKQASDLPVAQFISDCGEAIVKQIQNNKNALWLYGSCELEPKDLRNINAAIRSYFKGSGILLVIHNGILSISGDLALNGLVYQLITDEFWAYDKTARLVDWSKTKNDDRIASTIDEIHALSLPIVRGEQSVSYFQNGAFFPTGGLILDAPNTYAVVNTSLNTQYQKQITERLARKWHGRQWVSGSWNDQ